MMVPSWRRSPASSSKAGDTGRRSRDRRSKANRSIVEQLETRQLLTFSASLTGGVATFTVGATTDSVVFSQDGSGNLEHSTLTAPAGETFADDLDFDSTVAGSQHLAVSTASMVDVGGASFNATIGTPGSPASGLLASFNLTGTTGSSVTVDDSGSAVANTYTTTMTSISGNGINVSLAGSSFGGGVSLTSGTGINVVNVQGNSSPLTITNPGGADTVNVINGAGNLSDIRQPLTIVGTTGTTAVTLDDSSSGASETVKLIATGPNIATLSGFGGGEPINLSTGGGNTLAIHTGTGVNTHTIDFSQGNPIPNGLTYTGNPFQDSSLRLVFQGTLPGGPFTNDTYNATGPGSGNISFDGSTVSFTRALPFINDVTPAANFAFNYQAGGDARISIAPPSPLSTQKTPIISSFAATSQFTAFSYDNKTNAAINGGPGDDVFDVTGSALPAGSSTTINGQAGTNTLNYDAGGAQVVITPTGVAGQEIITRPGSGSLLVENFQDVNIVNGTIQGVPVVPPTFVAVPEIRGYVGGPLTNVEVAAFTSSDPNATASSFGATITWGDGTTTAGTVVADANNPTVFHVQGSHTYNTQSPSGQYEVGISVSQKDTNTTTIPGVTLSQTVVTTPQGGDSAEIESAPLTSQGATLSAVAGQPLTQALVASFTTVALAEPTTAFSGTISWGDGTTSKFFGSDVSVYNGVSISGTAYSIAASHTYSTFGTFPVTVIISAGDLGTTTIAQGTAVVTDAPITAPNPVTPIAATEGAPFNGTVASFTDSNTSALASDFQAIITWGDGHVTQGDRLRHHRLVPDRRDQHLRQGRDLLGRRGDPRHRDQWRQHGHDRRAGQRRRRGPDQRDARHHLHRERSGPVHCGRGRLHQRQPLGDGLRLHGDDRLGRRLPDHCGHHHRGGERPVRGLGHAHVREAELARDPAPDHGHRPRSRERRHGHPHPLRRGRRRPADGPGGDDHRSRRGPPDPGPGRELHLCRRGGRLGVFPGDDQLGRRYQFAPDRRRHHRGADLAIQL